MGVRRWRDADYEEPPGFERGAQGHTPTPRGRERYRRRPTCQALVFEFAHAAENGRWIIRDPDHLRPLCVSRSRTLGDERASKADLETDSPGADLDASLRADGRRGPLRVLTGLLELRGKLALFHAADLRDEANLRVDPTGHH